MTNIDSVSTIVLRGYSGLLKFFRPEIEDINSEEPLIGVPCQTRRIFYF